MKKQLIAALAVALMATAPALANEGPQSPVGGPGDHGKRGEERFKASDTNSDGALSREEFLAENAKRANEIYDKLDENKDSKLTQEEMKAGHEKMRAKMKERWNELKAQKEKEGAKVQ